MPVGVTSMAFQMSTLACRIKNPNQFRCTHPLSWYQQW
uniref:Uncharacterized protein n=1 Tax=Anguilla anguilla TaxID=7936 RepID=A0A0E9UFE8_ANGAN